MTAKRKFIEDAALVIDGRVAALEAELQKDMAKGLTASLASDRAAIMEARHLARLIRSLKIGSYKDPYKAAINHWDHGRAADNMNRT
jgi:hypothetical protein